MIAGAEASDHELSGDRAGRLKKSATAFRTISEVADDLHVPQHVLRFWETRFPQVKPLKRGGGRRYYRPDDVLLLRRIADLLYIQGYTIKGVQRLLLDGDGTLQGDLPPPDDADGDDESLSTLFERSDLEAPMVSAPASSTADVSGLSLMPQGRKASPDSVRPLLLEILTALEAIRRQMPG